MPRRRWSIAIAPRLGEAYASLAEILEYRKRWNEAAETFRRGIELSPRYATGHQWYAYDLMAWNRWDEALREMERARELDPLSYVIVVSLAAAYDGGDRPAKAAALYAQAQALSPDHPLTLQLLFAHELILGQMEPAAADFRRFLIRTGTDSARATDVERRLRDPALRPAVLREISRTGDAASALIIHRLFAGETATVAYLDSLAKSPQRDSINAPFIYAYLGPKLRANPRVQDMLAQLGYPRPQDFGKHQ